MGGAQVLISETRLNFSNLLGCYAGPSKMYHLKMDFIKPAWEKAQMPTQLVRNHL